LSKHIVGCHPADGSLVVFDPSGALVQRVEAGLTEGHGMAAVVVDGEELLWVADCGMKVVPSAEAQYGYELSTPRAGQVVLVRLDGSLVRRLPEPVDAAYESSPYRPTAVCVTDDGIVWAADGYGASLVHRYGPDGSIIETLSEFDCPHGLLLDRRREEPEVYIADRGNNRLVVHGTDGARRRVVAEGELDSPCSMASHGEYLFVAELRARVTILDGNDDVVARLGDNQEAAGVPGWPNALGNDGKVVRTPHLEAGRFNSPHGVAADDDGDVYISEWLVGGRFVKLHRVSS
jgi:hypothetical protein